MTVQITNLSRHYGRDAALAGIDLDIADGEFLALLGPSGAGKTTLLRLIAGLDRPDSGAILIDGVSVHSLSARERRIGFVFQNYALFRHMTVARNIAFGLSVQPRRRRPSRGRIAARVAELLDLMQLPGLGERLPAQLSGGQRQRVALARALAIDPKVLLLDEPFGALDAQVRGELRDWLHGLQRRLGLTTVFVTHDQHEAFQLADRVAILNGGRIEQVGEPAAIRARPASAFVRDFVGAGRHPDPSARRLELANRCVRRAEAVGAPALTPARSPSPAARKEEIAMPQPVGADADAVVPEPPDWTPRIAPLTQGAARGGDDLPTVVAGELCVLTVAIDAEPTSFEASILASANVVIYDRALAERVASLLPLGGYAEPAAGDAIDRCVQFVRDGWSVLRLTESDGAGDLSADDVQPLAEKLRRAGAPAELRVRHLTAAEDPSAHEARLEDVCESAWAGRDLQVLAVIFSAFAAAAATGQATLANGLAG